MDERIRFLLVEAYNRLKELNNSFNMTRVIMDDPDLRKEAGDMVRENREFLDRLFSALAFKDARSATNTSTGATAVSPETPLDTQSPAAADLAAGRTDSAGEPR